jgi:hypothetical protein
MEIWEKTVTRTKHVCSKVADLFELGKQNEVETMAAHEAVRFRIHVHEGGWGLVGPLKVAEEPRETARV